MKPIQKFVWKQSKSELLQIYLIVLVDIETSQNRFNKRLQNRLRIVINDQELLYLLLANGQLAGRLCVYFLECFMNWTIEECFIVSGFLALPVLHLYNAVYVSPAIFDCGCKLYLLKDDPE